MHRTSAAPSTRVVRAPRRVSPLTRIVRFAAACVLAGAALPAASQVARTRDVPADAWATLAALPGVRMTGAPGLKANVAVICDANCPYCARLDQHLRAQYPSLPVKWLPVAYFKPDSAALANRILAARDPAAELKTNYQNYDARARHGGLPAAAPSARLPADYAAIRTLWTQWGGFTPMVVVRRADGRVVKAMGSTPEFVDAALAQAAPSLRTYEEWRPASPTGD
ncbi:hypothetical protein [Marilutibacter spongiae]|uniref:Thioredoxin-like fold domain-containing protein n=1 Tax=Marilutibacter spongiae TaxID=2025720 RepID=A0A7W3TL13_9GAMM|nr:hypothetical protein [Lysobacter spongiae]MBB1060039.1 hypothetical protein [Lysobacter spongiae]